MANLTQDRQSTRKDGTLFAHPVAGATVIYSGALVNLDSTGYAVPSADNPAHTFAGKADERADNSAGADGDTLVEGHREGVFEFNATGMSQADVNEDVYIIDDNTVGKGITAQPVNVTGVVLKRIPASRGGAYQLAFTLAGTTLAWGGGTPVNVSAGGDFTLTATDGSQALATVTSASLPGANAADNMTLPHVFCGKIAEVASATSVYVDILGAVRG